MDEAYLTWMDVSVRDFVPQLAYTHAVFFGVSMHLYVLGTKNLIYVDKFSNFIISKMEKTINWTRF